MAETEGQRLATSWRIFCEAERPELICLKGVDHIASAAQGFTLAVSNLACLDKLTGFGGAGSARFGSRIEDSESRA